jgi:dihydrofolate synthase/folylpolyglutamate synthase
VTVESADAGYGSMTLPLLGGHQLENLATAVAAVETFAGRLGVGIEPSILKKGVSAVRWPGRLTVTSSSPTVLVDGAHNPQGAHALRNALKQLVGKSPVGIVIGMCRDKNASGFASALAPIAARAWVVPVDNERSFGTGELSDVLATGGLTAEPCGTLRAGLDAAVAWARDAGGMVCVAGSLFLAGEALELIGEEDG